MHFARASKQTFEQFYVADNEVFNDRWKCDEMIHPPSPHPNCPYTVTCLKMFDPSFLGKTYRYLHWCV